jgi:hypothetical protein
VSGSGFSGLSIPIRKPPPPTGACEHPIYPQPGPVVGGDAVVPALLVDLEGGPSGFAGPTLGCVPVPSIGRALLNNTLRPGRGRSWWKLPIPIRSSRHSRRSFAWRRGAACCCGIYCLKSTTAGRKRARLIATESRCRRRLIAYGPQVSTRDPGRMMSRGRRCVMPCASTSTRHDYAPRTRQSSRHQTELAQWPSRPASSRQRRASPGAALAGKDGGGE